MSGVDKVLVIALGNEAAGDDGAALAGVRRLALEHEVVLAGRPGTGLLELLDPARPTVLVDVTKSGRPPGTLVRMSLGDVADAAVALRAVSSHGLGPAEALRLARALGRALPRGAFVGIEGARFEPGAELSPAVAAALPELAAAVSAAARELAEEG